MLEKFFYEGQRVMLALAFVGHVNGEQTFVMAAEEGHNSGVSKELRAGFFALLVGRDEGIAAIIEDGCR